MARVEAHDIIYVELPDGSPVTGSFASGNSYVPQGQHKVKAVWLPDHSNGGVLTEGGGRIDVTIKPDKIILHSFQGTVTATPDVESSPQSGHVIGRVDAAGNV